MNDNQPSRRTLLLTWLLLMGLSIGTMITGRVTLDTSLGGLFMSALLVVTLLKALAILRTYLNLRAAPGYWTAAFTAFLVFLLVVILVLYLVGLTL